MQSLGRERLDIQSSKEKKNFKRRDQNVELRQHDMQTGSLGGINESPQPLKQSRHSSPLKS